MATQGRGRDAQLAFGETLMVIMVLVFLIGIGMVFYYSASRSSLNTELQHREDVQAVLLAQRVLSMPEVACDRYAGGSCIDSLKLAALARMLGPGAGHDAAAWTTYYGRFAEAAITVRYLTGAQAGQRLPLYDATPKDPGNFTAQQQFIFTTIYDPVADEQDLAYLNVTRYARRQTG